MKKFVTSILAVCLVLAFAGCEFAQTTSAPAEPSTQINVDRDFVYDWMLKHSELQNGEDLVYTFKDGQSELTVQTDTSKRIWVYYNFRDEEGNHVSMNTELFQDGSDRFECEILDDTETGVCHSYKFKRATFTRKSPIGNKEELGVYIDGGRVSIWMSPEGPKFAKGRHPSIKDYEPLQIDKYAALRNIRENFTERAQQHLCSTLDAIHNGLCVPMGITIHDLGYEAFEVNWQAEETPLKPDGNTPGFNDV